VLCSQCRQPVGPAIGSNGRHRRELICLACVAKNRHAPFGVRLRALRLAAGLSAHELGARIGVNAGAVLYWELRDKRPSEALVRRLADALGVKVRMLSVGVPK
jgi:DNA-binding transcriptional regulator YiaG